MRPGPFPQRSQRLSRETGTQTDKQQCDKYIKESNECLGAPAVLDGNGITEGCIEEVTSSGS